MTKDTFLLGVQGIVQRAQHVDETLRQRILENLTTDGFTSLSHEDMEALVEILDNAQDDWRQAALDTGDPTIAQESAELQEYLDEVMYEAEVAAFQNAGVDTSGSDVGSSTESQAQKARGMKLLDVYAGLTN